MARGTIAPSEKSASPEFQIAPPPRRVPFLLAAQVLTCSRMGQVAWLLLGFSLMFLWGIAFHADVASWYLLRGPLARVQGVVTGSQKTAFSEGGRQGRRGRPVYAHTYEFTAASGQKHGGTSYSLSSTVGPGVTVEYASDNPGISRIMGMRRKPFGAPAALVGVFPAAMAIWVVLSLRTGARSVRLLGQGEATRGRLIHRRRTAATVNKKAVYALTFEFKTRDGEAAETCVKTHVTEPLTDETWERLLYLPANPRCAVLMDSLPGQPLIDELGGLQVRRPGRAAATLIIPAISVLGHGVYLVLRYAH